MSKAARFAITSRCQAKVKSAAQTKSAADILGIDSHFDQRRCRRRVKGGARMCWQHVKAERNA